MTESDSAQDLGGVDGVENTKSPTSLLQGGALGWSLADSPGGRVVLRGAVEGSLPGGVEPQIGFEPTTC